MSLAAVAESIRALELPVDGDAIADALAAMDELAAKVCEALGEFDRVALWDVDAATSLVAWLRDRASLPARDAARLSRAARRLRSCPVTQAAWLEGRLSGGQVQAIVGNLSDRTVDLFSEHERELVPHIASLSVADTGHAMRSWAAHAEAVVRDVGWCDAHHVVAWTAGGVTAPHNLVLLCSRHHHRFHQPGWHVKLRPDATLEVTDRAGRVRTTDPPGW